MKIFKLTPPFMKALLTPPSALRPVSGMRLVPPGWKPKSVIRKAEGEACKPGETAANTGCTPASGEGGKKPAKVNLNHVNKPGLTKPENLAMEDQLEAMAAAGDYKGVAAWTPPAEVGPHTASVLANYQQALLDTMDEQGIHPDSTGEATAAPQVGTPSQPAAPAHPVTSTPAQVLQSVAGALAPLPKTPGSPTWSVDVSKWNLNKLTPTYKAALKKIQKMEALAEAGDWEGLAYLVQKAPGFLEGKNAPEKKTLAAYEKLISMKGKEQAAQPPLDVKAMKSVGPAVANGTPAATTTPATPAKPLPLDTVAHNALAKPEINPDEVHAALKAVADLTGGDLETMEPTWKLPPGMNPLKLRMGGVVFNDKGQVLLREPLNHFGGYVWTFPKGTIDPGEGPVGTALKEVLEETGQHGAIIGFIPGIHASGGSKNAYFAMKSTGEDAAAMNLNGETLQTKWVDFDEAEKLIKQTKIPDGVARDLAVLAAAKKAWEAGLKDKKVAGKAQQPAQATPQAAPAPEPPQQPAAAPAAPPASQYAGKPCPPGVSAADTGCIPADQAQPAAAPPTPASNLLGALTTAEIGELNHLVTSLQGEPAMVDDIASTMGADDTQAQKIFDELVTSGQIDWDASDDSYLWSGLPYQLPAVKPAAPAIQLPPKPAPQFNAAGSAKGKMFDEYANAVEALAKAGDVAGLENYKMPHNGQAPSPGTVLEDYISKLIVALTASQAPAQTGAGNVPAKPPTDPMDVVAAVGEKTPGGIAYASDIADATGLSFGEASNLILDMVKAGIVQDLPQGYVYTGKKPSDYKGKPCPPGVTAAATGCVEAGAKPHVGAGELKPSDISPMQQEVLDIVTSKGGSATFSQIVDQLGYSDFQIQTLIDKLKAKNLLVYNADHDQYEKPKPQQPATGAKPVPTADVLGMAAGYGEGKAGQHADVWQLEYNFGVTNQQAHDLFDQLEMGGQLEYDESDSEWKWTGKPLQTASQPVVNPPIDFVNSFDSKPGFVNNQNAVVAEADLEVAASNANADYSFLPALAAWKAPSHLNETAQEILNAYQGVLLEHVQNLMNEQGVPIPAAPKPWPLKPQFNSTLLKGEAKELYEYGEAGDLAGLESYSVPVNIEGSFEGDTLYKYRDDLIEAIKAKQGAQQVKPTPAGIQQNIVDQTKLDKLVTDKWADTSGGSKKVSPMYLGGYFGIGGKEANHLFNELAEHGVIAEDANGFVWTGKVPGDYAGKPCPVGVSASKTGCIPVTAQQPSTGPGLSTNQQSVLDYVHSSGGKVDIADVMTDMGLNKTDAQQTLVELVAAGKLEEFNPGNQFDEPLYILPKIGVQHQPTPPKKVVLPPKPVSPSTGTFHDNLEAIEALAKAGDLEGVKNYVPIVNAQGDKGTKLDPLSPLGEYQKKLIAAMEAGGVTPLPKPADEVLAKYPKIAEVQADQAGLTVTIGSMMKVTGLTGPEALKKLDELAAAGWIEKPVGTWKWVKTPPTGALSKPAQVKLPLVPDTFSTLGKMAAEKLYKVAATGDLAALEAIHTNFGSDLYKYHQKLIQSVKDRQAAIPKPPAAQPAAKKPVQVPPKPTPASHGFTPGGIIESKIDQLADMANKGDLDAVLDYETNSELSTNYKNQVAAAMKAAGITSKHAGKPCPPGVTSVATGCIPTGEVLPELEQFLADKSITGGVETLNDIATAKHGQEVDSDDIEGPLGVGPVAADKIYNWLQKTGQIIEKNGTFVWNDVSQQAGQAKPLDLTNVVWPPVAGMAAPQNQKAEKDLLLLAMSGKLDELKAYVLPKMKVSGLVPEALTHYQAELIKTLENAGAPAAGGYLGMLLGYPDKPSSPNTIIQEHLDKLEQLALAGEWDVIKFYGGNTAMPPKVQLYKDALIAFNATNAANQVNTTGSNVPAMSNNAGALMELLNANNGQVTIKEWNKWYKAYGFTVEEAQAAYKELQAAGVVEIDDTPAGGFNDHLIKIVGKPTATGQPALSAQQQATLDWMKQKITGPNHQFTWQGLTNAGISDNTAKNVLNELEQMGYVAPVPGNKGNYVLTDMAKPGGQAAPPTPAAKPVPPKPAGLKPTAGWKKISSKKGSNTGGQYEDENGKKWYVKTPPKDDVDHAKSEVLAGKLYELVGAAVPDYHLADTPDGIGTATPWQEHGKDFDPTDHQHQQAATENFAVHAWLANWDALGASSDNQVWVKNADGTQTLTTIDTGGSLNQKATGGHKPFGNTVPELVNLLNPQKNQTAAAAFENITPDQLLNSLAKVTNLSDAAIDQMVNNFAPGDQAAKDALKKTLLARKAYLQHVSNVVKGQLGQFAGKPCPPGVTAKATGCIPTGATEIPMPAGPVSGLPAPAPQPGQVAAVPIGMPAKPWFSAETHKQKAEKIYQAAMSGNVQALLKIPTNAGSPQAGQKKLHNYKMGCIASIQSGWKPGPALGTPQAAPAAPKPPAYKPGTPIPADKFSAVPASSKPEKMAVMQEMLDLAMKGDLLGLQAYQPDPAKVGGGTTVSAYKNTLTEELNAFLNPPPPPKGYDGSLDGLTKVFKGALDPAAAHATKVAYYLVTEVPGVPSVDFGGVKIKYTPVGGYSNGNNLEAPYQKQHDDAWDQMNVDIGGNELHDYTDGSYRSYNAALILGKPGTVPHVGTADSSDVKKAKKLGEWMTNNAPILPTGTEIHRGVDLSPDHLKEFLASEGMVLQPTTFSSTRMTKDTGYAIHANVQFHFKCAPGVRAMWADTRGANKGEVEMVLPPGQRYLIKSVTKGSPPDKRYHVEAILLPTVPGQCC